MTTERHCLAALAGLFILHAVMIGALYTGTAPHPPLAVAPFALGPFLGAALAVIAAAAVLGPDTGAGRVAGGMAALLALVSFGPQKYLDPAFPQIWPAVLTAQLAIVVVLVHAARGALAGRRAVTTP